MDLNHVRLSSKLVADLYHNSLIETTDKNADFAGVSATIEPTVPVFEKSDKSWKSLGNNQKSILIAVKYSNAVYLPDHDLSFLTGIISACKLTIADVAIINLHHYPELTYKDLTSRFQSRIVFLFGVEPEQFGLPLSFPHFQIQTFANITYLFSPALKELENDKDLKGKLWLTLKKIFNL